MSGKSAKRLRRQIKKFNKEVFKDFTIEISSMKFWDRFKFCLNMAFCRHEMQKGLKPEIEARRLFNRDGEAKAKPVHRSFRLTRKATEVA